MTTLEKPQVSLESLFSGRTNENKTCQEETKTYNKEEENKNDDEVKNMLNRVDDCLAFLKVNWYQSQRIKSTANYKTYFDSRISVILCLAAFRSLLLLTIENNETTTKLFSKTKKRRLATKQLRAGIQEECSDMKHSWNCEKWLVMYADQYNYSRYSKSKKNKFFYKLDNYNNDEALICFVISSLLRHHGGAIWEKKDEEEDNNELLAKLQLHFISKLITNYIIDSNDELKIALCLVFIWSK